MELVLSSIERYCASGRGSLEVMRRETTVFILATSLCLLQVFDGLLTSVGVARYGTDVEGNPLIRGLMEQMGSLPALGLVKLLSIIIVLGLAYFAPRVPWIKGAMGAVTCFYLFAAIIPWTYILFIKPLI